ncbi:MAG: uncharacterized protein JWL64_1257 [Frankiales bacterium]|nr:uncharacterized protein [Frankiales bacterium]
MQGVTISASYGAGGSVIAPLLAERLGFPLLDRAMSASVAAQLNVTVPEAEKGVIRRSIVERLFGVHNAMDHIGVAFDTSSGIVTSVRVDDTAQFRDKSEALMRAALDTGAVVLGRAGSAAFRDTPGVLRVRLYGPRDRRITQAARLEGIPVATAAARIGDVDQSRAAYVRRLYGVDIHDAGLYQLQIDSTALPHEACVDLIVRAYEALVP